MYFELFEKVKIEYMNVFYRVPANPEQLQAMQEQFKVQIMEMQTIF